MNIIISNQNVVAYLNVFVSNAEIATIIIPIKQHHHFPNTRIMNNIAHIAQDIAKILCHLCIFLFSSHPGVRDTQIRYTGTKNPKNCNILPFPISNNTGNMNIAAKNVIKLHKFKF